MLQREADWRHLLAAGLVVAALFLAGWRLATRPPALPNVPAPAGPHARMQDAPELPPAGPPGR